MMKYQVRDTLRAKITCLKNDELVSRIENFVADMGDSILAVYGSSHAYDEPKELINMRSPVFVSVEWLDLKIVEVAK